MAFSMLNNGVFRQWFSVNDAWGAQMQWGRRLSDAVRAALRSGDFEVARKLALEGDGQTRGLEKEYTFMIRGLGITIRVLLALLEERATRADSGALVDRFGADLKGFGAAGDTKDVAALLEALEQRFVAEQSRLAREVVQAIDARDAPRALDLLEAKEQQHYVPLHDRLVRFMAESFAWVYQSFGAQELLRFHMATAERQRAGFDKWEGMPAADFAATTAFLLKQHMGRVEVREDDEKFTIEQTPCGSGGRLRLAGAYAGKEALPFVEGAGALTFGEASLPVYCTHCPVWNGVAPLQWYGRAHWVFENAARADGGCTLHIYKRHDATPADYVRRLKA